jgi:hypothetical protein
MLNLVKEQVAPEVIQTVSSMVNKTVQAMNQLKVARKLTVSILFNLLFLHITDGCFFR